MLRGGDLRHGQRVLMLALSTLRNQEAVPEALHDFALASRVRKLATSLEEGAGGPTQALLRGDDCPLGRRDGEDGRLQLPGLGHAGLQAGQPTQLLAGATMSGLDRGHGTLMRIESMAELDACSLLGHFTKSQNDAQSEAVAHHSAPPRKMGGRWLPGCGDGG